ncbi:MAG: HAD family phosphatase [Aquidulcibacter sp.]|jgi:HAD superfamily hydrolase (TIGR01509 family)|uniref:HAD family hydrolase n=1 Tax=Aquidulcibacter sp. TaxID=2052990 RepID=UPI0022C065C7|nr:HAD family phosphatase [Aquidulcibacter sp.]MCZ8208232.1 HAD family phosphatase [Aquidulcibacter sp.]
MQHQPKLVIFDCDGVLVDSESIANEVGAEWITALGWSMDAAEARARFLGLSDAAMFALIEQKIGRAITAKEIAQNHERITARFEAELKAIPGVVAVVEDLAARSIPLAVASSGERAKILANLAKVGLLNYFGQQISSATEVAEAKPAPDVYLLAARKAGYEPSDCIAIEDSPNGVLAALRAGMQVIGFARETPAPDLTAAGAHQVFETMAEVHVHLEQVL